MMEIDLVSVDNIIIILLAIILLLVIILRKVFRWERNLSPSWIIKKEGNMITIRNPLGNDNELPVMILRPRSAWHDGANKCNWLVDGFVASGLRVHILDELSNDIHNHLGTEYNSVIVVANKSFMNQGKEWLEIIQTMTVKKVIFLFIFTKQSTNQEFIELISTSFRRYTKLLYSIEQIKTKRRLFNHPIVLEGVLYLEHLNKRKMNIELLVISQVIKWIKGHE
ncbi:MAG: hypothetical protein ACTSUE_14855 [Promethearchaeota archaeon]